MADTFDYGSSDALIRHIKERADDIDAIWIVFDNAVKIRRLDGTSTTKKNVAGVVRYCDGSTSMIHAVDAELMLNDEGVRRLRIPFRLLLPGQSLPGMQSGDS
jgi:hypothetical protein